ncbi:MAG TPA: glycosyltransferase family 25 protein [Chlamydiales bacterium]|jgi:GR25 family glycosyltransferase involved in LPS biosynthesis|nr:glycosyltransferase family 25 protein [Chlamydiales bacterium]
MAWMLALLAVFSSTIFAKIEDHFKKAPGKLPIHAMRNIDFIYMINLDERPEKFKQCTDQLHPYGIYPYRFSAVNGWQLSLEAINDIGLKFEPGMEGGFLGTSFLTEDFMPYHEPIQTYGQAYFCHCTARGTLGIMLSHLSVLQDAYDSGYETIWVMEDDVDVLQDPTLLPDLIDRLDKKVGKENWDVLFTDQDIRDANGKHIPCYGIAKRPNFKPESLLQYYQKKDISRDFRRIGARFGAHSMILRRSGIEKILFFIKEHQIFLPYDMDYYLPKRIRLYCLTQDIVSNQAKAISDNGGPNYLK